MHDITLVLYFYFTYVNLLTYVYTGHLLAVLCWSCTQVRSQTVMKWSC